MPTAGSDDTYPLTLSETGAVDIIIMLGLVLIQRTIKKWQNILQEPAPGAPITPALVGLPGYGHKPGIRIATCPSRYVKPNRNASTRSSNSYRFVIAGQQEGRCNGCKVEFPFRNMTVDHARPQSRGGDGPLGEPKSTLQLLQQPQG